jgi:hypothetical protein
MRKKSILVPSRLGSKNHEPELLFTHRLELGYAARPSIKMLVVLHLYMLPVGRCRRIWITYVVRVTRRPHTVEILVNKKAKRFVYWTVSK